MDVSEGVSAANSIGELCVPLRDGIARPAAEMDAEREVLRLFDEFYRPLLRYGLSLGISGHDAEEVVQETFLALFEHLQRGRPRDNLRGWLFRVTHNLALKQGYAMKAARDRTEDGEAAKEPQDPALTPEEHLSAVERQRRLLAVVQALPETDQACLRLRAEGLRYREISAVLGISLGAVSMSLTRSFSRLSRADGRG
jgi:RNA polymerase sigma-70 factor, ECF subfamily